MLVRVALIVLGSYVALCVVAAFVVAWLEERNR